MTSQRHILPRSPHGETFMIMFFKLNEKNYVRPRNPKAFQRFISYLNILLKFPRTTHVSQHISGWPLGHFFHLESPKVTFIYLFIFRWCPYTVRRPITLGYHLYMSCTNIASRFINIYNYLWLKSLSHLYLTFLHIRIISILHSLFDSIIQSFALTPGKVREDYFRASGWRDRVIQTVLGTHTGTM